ncbi:hypothetical protein SSX86_013744 [Deinandra increscens subsp. villosa]|uniref:Alpha-ketoglutarate-dependent dioxygenase AlkB-like domain-containing protein n=1 Tax=Deinandra increscens subsp. villosa TaxID=3103831 RepID=A0AAP0D5U2_9ASTR
MNSGGVPKKSTVKIDFFSSSPKHVALPIQKVVRTADVLISDGSEPPPIPSEFISLAEATIQDAQAHLDDLPSMRPDTCLVHFYEPAFAHNGLRQDLYESSDSLQRGLPVVSISIGNAALFLYGNTNDEKKLDLVVLHSGDVLIYGGKSRPMFHKLEHIFGVSPGPLIRETAIRAGNLNLTLRQF